MDGWSFHDFARKSFHYSFFLTQQVFYPAVHHAFYRLWKWPCCVSPDHPMLSALESCEALIRENNKILFQTFQLIKCRDTLEDPSEAQGMADLLRGLVRNHETCFDGLSGAVGSADATTASEIKHLLSHRSGGSESFNVTAVLFRLGWGQHQDQIIHSGI
nr:pectinesterase-like [Ipomoea trifida]GMD03591.1 pectinesterase-like [Ipomoea batatas]